MSQVSGKIVQIGSPVVNEKNTWKKLEFTIQIENTYNPDYPKFAKFNVGNKPDADTDKVELFVKYRKVGEIVDVDYNHDGFGWKDKTTGEQRYMTQLSAWKVWGKTEDADDPCAGGIEESDIPKEDPPF